MKKIACMTSMHQPYYDHIGRHMIESWQKYWPRDIELYFYAEKMSFNSTDPRIRTIDWDESCFFNWNRFAKKTEDINAQKLGKKGWASLHGWKNIDADYIIWLDADMLFSKEITKEVIYKTINDNYLVALFDNDYQRKESTRTFWSAESGYVIVNKNHKNFNDFVKRYEDYYNYPYKPEGIESWWDNEILMLTSSHFIDSVHDLSQHRQTNKTQTPLNHCFLGEYMSHFKGKSKKLKTQEEFFTFINRI